MRRNFPTLPENEAVCVVVHARVPGGAGLRKAIYEAKSAPEILVRVEEFLRRGWRLGSQPSRIRAEARTPPGQVKSPPVRPGTDEGVRSPSLQRLGNDFSAVVFSRYAHGIFGSWVNMVSQRPELRASNSACGFRSFQGYKSKDITQFRSRCAGGIRSRCSRPSGPPLRRSQPACRGCGRGKLALKFRG